MKPPRRGSCAPPYGRPPFVRRADKEFATLGVLRGGVVNDEGPLAGPLSVVLAIRSAPWRVLPRRAGCRWRTSDGPSGSARRGSRRRTPRRTVKESAPSRSSPPQSPQRLAHEPAAHTVNDSPTDLAGLNSPSIAQQDRASGGEPPQLVQAASHVFPLIPATPSRW